MIEPEKNIEEKSEEIKKESHVEAHEETPREKSVFKEYLDALLFACLVALVLKILFIEAYRIPTGSMENTLVVGDFLLVNKFIYGITTPRSIPFTDIRIPYFRLPAFKQPKRGDVIVFDFPGNRDELQSKEVVNYIKRLVGEPGDSIIVIDGKLYVNNQLMSNPENSISSNHPRENKDIDPRIFPKGSGWNEDNYGPIRVPKKGDVIKINTENFDGWKYFIMREGHSIRISTDKKIFVDEIENNEYTVGKDYYFMMGDNRNNSLDSRFWGFASRELFVGQAMMIYWSWNPSIPFSDMGKLFSSVRWSRVAKIIE